MDLRDWVDSAGLLAIIEEEVRTLPWDHPRVLEHLRQHPGYRPKAMLRLLSYAYIVGVFDSQEIVENCRSNTVFRRLSEGLVPFPNELASFRRRNRRLLERVLNSVFRFASSEARGRNLWGAIQMQEEGFSYSHGIERLNIARHIDTAEC